MSAARYASGYIARGLAVVPVVHGEKKCIQRDWQNLRIGEDDVLRHFSGGPLNVGILLGKPSGGVVDVDLDVPEAAQLAEHFLPPSVTSGRDSSPQSHWFLRASGITSEKWKDIDGKVIVEVRSTGCQTLVEPSVHPSGESCRWTRNGAEDFAELTASELRARCVDLAAATLLARHLPPIGGRHEYALAVAGYLLRPGRLDAERTFKLMMTAWSTAEDADQEAFRDVAASVRDTSSNLTNGRMVVGGPTLDEIVPGLPALLARYYGWDERVQHVVAYEHNMMPSPEVAPWPTLADAALYGPAGEIVRAVDPYTEADRVAVLLSLLAAVGNVIGRGAHLKVGPDIHYLNLFVALVGETSKGRKGTSWSPIRWLLHASEPVWADEHVANGLSSGEGLIYAVRDRVVGENANGEAIVSDEGVADKRLFVLEAELANVLKVMRRDGNTLSPILRQAYDGDCLRTMTRNNPLKATGAHISIIGHITAAELTRYLTETESANGFANRFLWIAAKRSKLLPFGGDWSALNTAPLVAQINAAIGFGQKRTEIMWGQSADQLWRETYGPLSEGAPGMFGAVTGRAEVHTIRLAALYAVMDTCRTIELPHLEAALAIWKYAADSARRIFGDATGNPVADRIMKKLRATPEGLIRTEISKVFQRHQTKEQIDSALALLVELGRVHSRLEPTDGRTSERWIANQ